MAARAEPATAVALVLISERAETDLKSRASAVAGAHSDDILDAETKWAAKDGTNPEIEPVAESQASSDIARQAA